MGDVHTSQKADYSGPSSPEFNRVLDTWLLLFYYVSVTSGSQAVSCCYVV